MTTAEDAICVSFGYSPDSLECGAIKSRGKLTKEQQRAFTGEAAGKGAAAACTAYGGAAVAPLCEKIGEWVGELVFDTVSAIFTDDSEKRRAEERAAWSSWNAAAAVYADQMTAIQQAAIEVIRLTLQELCKAGDARPFGLYLPPTSYRGQLGLLFTPPACEVSDEDAWAMVFAAGGQPISDWLDTMAFAFMAGTRTSQATAQAEANANMARLEPWAKLVQLSTIRAASNLATAYAVEMEQGAVGWPTTATEITFFPFLVTEPEPPLTAAQLTAVPMERRSWKAAGGIVLGLGLALGGVGLTAKAVA